jgi:hypothetical protein
LILHFKYLFHLRPDNSLLNIISKINSENKNWQKNIVFEIDNKFFPENGEFFTNVEKLIQAYTIIINLILDVVVKNKMNKPEVKLSLLVNPNGIDFSIHHKNSVYKKSIKDVIGNRRGQVEKNLIKFQINGLCDFYLKADFGNNQFAKINIWDGKPKKAMQIDDFAGVEYIFKFRK